MQLPKVSDFIDQNKKVVVSVCLEEYSAGTKNPEEQYIHRKRRQLYLIKISIGNSTKGEDSEGNDI